MDEFKFLFRSWPGRRSAERQRQTETLNDETLLFSSGLIPDSTKLTKAKRRNLAKLEFGL